MADVVEDMFHLDSRLVRTIVPLILHPGFLTREYNAGRRVRYFPPLRLYLSISVVFFLVLTLSGVRLMTVNVGGKGRASAESRIGGHEAPSAPAVEPAKGSWRERASRAAQQSELLNHLAAKRLPHIMFFLLPAFAIVLRLLYRRQDAVFLHHLVFALHMHSLGFTLLLIALLVRMAGGFDLVPLAQLLVVLYLFRSLRVVFAQSFLRTLGKLFLLLAGYLVALILAFASLAVLLIYEVS